MDSEDEAAGGPEDYVRVPVPKAYVSAVYRALAEAMEATADGESDLDSPPEASCPYCGQTAFLRSAIGLYQCGTCGLAFRYGRGMPVDRDNGVWTKTMIVQLKSELGDSTAARVIDIVAQHAPQTVGY